MPPISVAPPVANPQDNIAKHSMLSDAIRVGKQSANERCTPTIGKGKRQSGGRPMNDAQADG